MLNLDAIRKGIKAVLGTCEIVIRKGHIHCMYAVHLQIFGDPIFAMWLIFYD